MSQVGEREHAARSSLPRPALDECAGKVDLFREGCDLVRGGETMTGDHGVSFHFGQRGLYLVGAVVRFNGRVAVRDHGHFDLVVWSDVRVRHGLVNLPKPLAQLPPDSPTP